MGWWKRIRENERWQLWLILAIAAFLRVWLLDIRPPHFDEGINGWFVDQMRIQGYYKYDPENYHGPLHFYILFISLSLFGRNLWALRMPVVLVGIAAVWLVLRCERFLGRATARWAALVLAISPGFVFYNRYSIHETWLELFLILFVYGLAGLRNPGTREYLWATVMGVTGMILTKETYIIHLTAFALAWPCVLILERFVPVEVPQPPPLPGDRWTRRDLLKCVATGIGAIVVLYSGTFLNLPGVAGLWKTFSYWVATGEHGHGHDKSPIYWLLLLRQFEWPLLMGLGAAMILPFFPTPRLIRYLCIYGCGTFVAYSLVPYKTPWCIISIVWPFAFAFGAAITLLQNHASKRLVAAFALIALLFSGAVSANLNFVEYTNRKLPYVYVQTFEEMEKITKPLLTLARQNPENYHMKGYIVCSSYYPLPWVLGDFSNIGYFGSNPPESPDADFLLVDTSLAGEVEKNLKNDYFTTTLELREAQEKSKLYLRYEKFKSLFPNRSPEFIGAK